MAVVGSAEIIVKAITSGVAKDIEDGLNNSRTRSSTKRAGKDLAQDFTDNFGKSARSEFARTSQDVSKSFHKMIRSSYYVQSGVMALAGSISSLVGGLGAFIGAAGGAASTGIVLANAMTQIKVASLVGKAAFSGVSQAVAAAGKANTSTTKTVKDLREEMQQLAFDAEEAALKEEDAALALEKARENLARVQNLPPDNRARREAELAYRQADLAYRRALDRSKDLEDERKNPKKKGKTGTDPYAGLTKSQKQFAQYLVSIQAQLKGLNEAAAGSFLPVLQTQIQRMFSSGAFSMLIQGYKQVGEALGEASFRLANSLFDPTSMAGIRDIFIGTSKTVMALGTIFGNLIKSFLTLYRATSPVFNMFRDFLSTSTTNMAKDLAGNFANISGFFRKAAQTAAMFGSVIGNVFAGLKNMIKANTGPGTGGYMLVEQLKASTKWMREMGTAAGEFSSKAYFKATAENTLAITNAFSGFFSMMKDLGASPDVKLFWDTLAQGQDSLRQIIAAATATGPILAEILVSVAEIAASFTDSGQIKTYLEIISGVFKAMAGFLKSIQPIMQILGPIIGAMGALITLGLLFKKVYMIGFGTVMAAMKVMSAIQAVLLAKKYGESIANGVVMASNMGLGASYIGLGGTMAGVTAIASAMWVAITGPIGLAILAIAAVGAAIAAAIGITAAINADRVKKSVTALSGSFRDAAKHTLSAADASSQWANALLTVTDAEKASIQDMSQVNGLYATLAKERAESAAQMASQDWVSVTQTAAEANAQKAVEAANAAFKSYGDTLAKIAKKSLPDIQRNYRNLVVTQGMSKEATLGMLDASEDMTKSLEAQAKALGDTIYNSDGTVNAQKRLDYALGEGSYLLAKARVERAKFNQTMKDAVQTFIDTKGPLEQSSQDLQKYSDTVVTASGAAGFSLKKYKEDLLKQQRDLDQWSKNIAVLSKKMSDGALKELVAMGKGGAALVASLVTGTGNSLKVNEKALKAYQDQVIVAAEAQKKATAIAAAVTDPRALTTLLNKKFGGQGTLYNYAMQEIQAGSKSLSAIAADYGITIDELIAQQQKYGTKDVAAEVNIKGVWDKASISNLKSEFEKAMGATTYVITTKKADGGLIGRVRQFANGGIARFADGSGGPVSGPGGPRSDMIPAMLSNGEYVVNAASTAKNLELLRAINAGQSVSGPGINISVNAAPGMSEREIATLVANRLQFEMRKGASV